MNTDLKNFVVSLLRVVLPTLMLVATVAFLSMPFTLGQHPGETTVAQSSFGRHMS